MIGGPPEPGRVIPYKGYYITEMKIAKQGIDAIYPVYYYEALGKTFNSLGEAQRYIDEYIRRQEQQQGGSSAKPKPPSPPKPSEPPSITPAPSFGDGTTSTGTTGAGGAGGGLINVTPRQEGGGGGGGGSSGGTQHVVYEVKLPEWIESALKGWMGFAKETIPKIEEQWQAAYPKIAEGIQKTEQLFTQSLEDLQKAYAQSLGVVQMEAITARENLRTLTRRGLLSSGAAEQVITKSMRQLASGVQQATSSYYKARTATAGAEAAALAQLYSQYTSGLRAYASLLASVPNPWASFSAFLSAYTNYAGVATTG